MTDNKWTKSLKDKIESSENLPVPKTSWDELEAGMDRISRRRIVWRIVGGLSAAAAVLCMFFLMPYNQKNTVRTDIITLTKPIAAIETHEKDILAENIMPEVPPMPNHKHRNTAIRKSAQATDKKIEQVDIQDIPKNITNDDTPDESFTKSIDLSEEIKPESKIDEDIAAVESVWEQLVAEEQKPDKKDNRISLGIGPSFLGNILYSQDAFSNNLSQPSRDSVSSSLHFPSSETLYSDASGTPNSTDDENKIKMREIFSLGISIKYRLSDRWFATGNLNATYFNSFKNDSKYNLWYIGPSIGIGTDIFHNYSTSIYASATGQVNWCVNRDNYPVLFSAALSAGIQHQLDKSMWIYLEPQLKYYFNTGKNQEIDLEHRLNFALNLGIRFDL